MLRDGGDQARVAGEAEEVVDTVRLTPSHQFLAGEARICPCKDLHAPPASPNLADEPGHLIFGVGGLVAEHVERQIAVAVVAVIEAALRVIAAERGADQVQTARGASLGLVDQARLPLAVAGNPGACGIPARSSQAGSHAG
jgi:hypothetical protein